MLAAAQSKNRPLDFFFGMSEKKNFFLLFFRILGPHVRFLLRPIIELCDVSVPDRKFPFIKFESKQTLKQLLSMSIQ